MVLKLLHHTEHECTEGCLFDQDCQSYTFLLGICIFFPDCDLVENELEVYEGSTTCVPIRLRRWRNRASTYTDSPSLLSVSKLSVASIQTQRRARGMEPRNLTVRAYAAATTSVLLATIASALQAPATPSVATLVPCGPTARAAARRTGCRRSWRLQRILAPTAAVEGLFNPASRPWMPACGNAASMRIACTPLSRPQRMAAGSLHSV